VIKLKHLPLQDWTTTSEFGNRDYKPNPWHNGIDGRAVTGTSVYAVADGTVKVAKDNPTGYGLYIVINHGSFGSLYAHLSKFNVSVGEELKAGTIIGYSGNTGACAGPHLHFELRECEYKDFWDRCKFDKSVYMRCVDPFPYFMELYDRNNLSIEQSKRIVKEHAELSDSTIDYLANDYKYGNDLIVKLAKAIR
jgi:murein DD-endopeptidase MepM/ murein hydrolase activator NlpD